MSRSRRKTPIIGWTTAPSEKEDKRLANRRLRRIVRNILRTQEDPDVLPDLREVSDPWDMNKDGKQWIDPDSKWMRK